MRVPSDDLGESLLSIWRVNNRLTVYLLENLPNDIWKEKIPGATRRTVRSVYGHMHNARCMWIKMLGREHDLAPPPSVNLTRVTPKQLVTALGRSSKGIETLIELDLARGGRLPGFSMNVAHFVSYLAVHEGHHRGQVCLVARQLGHRVPVGVQQGLWQWSRRAKEI